MKTARANRNSVINRADSICIAASKDFKKAVEEKARDMGISVSSLVRMALSEFMKNH
jgi:post-segregation antitoxin (ccd killing protein)